MEGRAARVIELSALEPISYQGIREVLALAPLLAADLGHALRAQLAETQKRLTERGEVVEAVRSLATELENLAGDANEMSASHDERIRADVRFDIARQLRGTLPPPVIHADIGPEQLQAMLAEPDRRES